jgi:hypothetical protein
MSDPWQFFQLDAGHRTLPELKKAYARLLRENRPDENPAGFQRVHEAYQRALQYLENAAFLDDLYDPSFEDSEEDEEDDAPGSDFDLEDQPPVPTRERPVANLPPVQPSCARELAQLQLTLKTWPKAASLFQNAKKIKQACGQVSQAMAAANLHSTNRLQMWACALGDDLGRIARRLHASILLELFRLGQIPFCKRVTRRWLMQENIQSLNAFTRILAEVKSQTLTDESASLMVSLALEIATADPMTAESLASSAYAHYGHRNRGRIPSNLDNQIWLGKQILLLPKRFRNIWAGWLSHDRPKLDSITNHIFETIYATAELAPKDWRGWSGIRPRMSTDIEEFLDRCLLGRQMGLVFLKFRAKEYRQLAKNSPRLFWTLLLFFACPGGFVVALAYIYVKLTLW